MGDEVIGVYLGFGIWDLVIDDLIEDISRRVDRYST